MALAFWAARLRRCRSALLLNSTGTSRCHTAGKRWLRIPAGMSPQHSRCSAAWRSRFEPSQPDRECNASLQSSAGDFPRRMKYKAHSPLLAGMFQQSICRTPPCLLRFESSQRGRHCSLSLRSSAETSLHHKASTRCRHRPPDTSQVHRHCTSPCRSRLEWTQVGRGCSTWLPS